VLMCLASVAMNVFSHLIDLRGHLINAIYKDNAAINCVTVQHKIDPFPPILTSYFYFFW
jgi:hypothetical protein